MGSIKFLLRIAVAVALVVFLLNKHEITALTVLERLKAMPVGFFLAALAVDLLGQTICALRWARISALGGNPISFRQAWPIYFSGMFFNTCLPTTIGGDTLRVVGLSRHTGSKSVAFASVFMDRNIGMAALLGLGLLASLAAPITFQGTLRIISHHPLVFPLWPLFVLLIPAYVLINMIFFSNRVYRRFDRWVFQRLPGFLGRKITKLHDALQAYRLPLTTFSSTFALSLVYQASEGALVWILAWGLGLHLSFWVFCAMVMVQAVAGLLPISINNIGVRDGIFCAILMGQATVLGQTPDMIKGDALALAWFYLAVVVASGLLGGVVYLVTGVRRPTEKDVEELETGMKNDEPALVPTGK